MNLERIDELTAYARKVEAHIYEDGARGPCLVEAPELLDLLASARALARLDAWLRAHLRDGIASMDIDDKDGHASVMLRPGLHFRERTTLPAALSAALDAAEGEKA